MPTYEYQCPKGHRTELFRKVSQRTRKVACPTCGTAMGLVISRPHVAPDGVYSYCPNIGTEADFERKRHAIREGIKVQPKQS